MEAAIIPFEREDGQWDWKLVAVTGEEVCGSLQGFRDSTDARRAAQRAKELMADATVERG